MDNQIRRRKFNIKLLSLIFLMIQEISVLQALPQRGTSNEPSSAGNIAREATDDPKVAKTIPRKVDNRMEPQKLNPNPIRGAAKEEKDDSVKFPSSLPATNSGAIKPSTQVANRGRLPDTADSAANAQKRSLIPDPKDTKKCQQNFLECKGFNYYPSDVVEKLVLEGKIHKNLLVNEVLNPKIYDISTRLDGSPDDSTGKRQFCNFRENIFFPDGGKNREGEYRFIVQAPKLNITQGIRTETCDSRGDNSCGGLKSHLPSNYQLECVQKYAYKQFVTLSATGPTQEPIEIPSCCVCMYSDRKRK